MLLGLVGPRLREVIAELGTDGILLGVAVNQWEFVQEFERLVLLELDPVTQQKRIAYRDPLFRAQIQSGLPIFQTQMLERGAARVDAARTTTEVADGVLELLAPRGAV